MIEVGDTVEYLGDWTGDKWAKGQFYTVKKISPSLYGRADIIYPTEVDFGNDFIDKFRLVSKGSRTFTLPIAGVYNHSVSSYSIASKEYRPTLEAKPKECWCGSDSVKSSIHSDYCPKYGR
jgi:hypothetical protein